MPATQEQLDYLAVQLEEVIHLVREQDEEIHSKTTLVCPRYATSVQNLMHYAAFRSLDVRGMQKSLKQLGLTRLANAEGNILGSLVNLKSMVDGLRSKPSDAANANYLSIGEGKKMLHKHTDKIFGAPSKDRRVRIMVTQPSEAATDYHLVLGMVKNGMDCARINCAHDGPKVWKSIIENIRKAEQECSTKVAIAMDLAGPKIRTGVIAEGPKIKRIKSLKSAHGEKGMAFIKLVADDNIELKSNEIPVTKQWMESLRVGDDIKLKDVRGRSRKIKVVQTDDDYVLLLSPKSITLASGTTLKPSRKKLKSATVGELPGMEQHVMLREGDFLLVGSHWDQAVLPLFDKEGNVKEPGRIGCSPPEMVQRMQVGAPILFDDGKIEGIVVETHPEWFKVEITRADAKGSKLKSEKGINVPTTDLGISGLTEKDKEDLKFVAQNADIVNFSFVNTEDDVRELLQEMEKLGAKDSLGLILKIETQLAYKNLVGILITAMQAKKIGVMIARGDLALEVGWKNMAMVQEGILSFCSAAHVPVVWATQVLESLAKKGIPSRSEITDITSSVQAECVMLNKGPHIHKAISFLDEVLVNMENSHDKKEVMLPKMEW
jgi:Pyruvate kinase